MCSADDYSAACLVSRNWREALAKIKRRRNWVPSLAYGFIRGRQLDGSLSDGDPKTGVYAITTMRVLAGWGSVSQQRWSYPRGRPAPWPLVEPPGLDAIAKFNRSLGHFQVRDLDDARRCIFERMFVSCCCLPIHAGWAKAPGGLISMPSTDVPLDGRHHSVCLEGYDDHTQFFKFWNNWGSGWGQGGYGYLPYQYFTSFVEEAWTFIMPLGYQCPPRKKDDLVILERGFVNRLGNPWFVIDLWKTTDGTRIGWCMVTVRNDWFEVEDFFIRPEYADDSGHRSLLLTRILRMAEERLLSVRFWIPQADTHYRSANFATINNVIREGRLTVKPSGVTWATYRAERRLRAFVAAPWHD
jgi:hypothetical protein